MRVCVQRSFHECWHRCSVREQWRAAASGSAGGIAVMVGASGSQWCSRLGAHTGGRDGKVHRHGRCRQHSGRAQQPRSRRRPGPGVRKLGAGSNSSSDAVYMVSAAGSEGASGPVSVGIGAAAMQDAGSLVLSTGSSAGGTAGGVMLNALVTHPQWELAVRCLSQQDAARPWAVPCSLLQKPETWMKAT